MASRAWRASARRSPSTRSRKTREPGSIEDTGKREVKTVPARTLYVCLDCGFQFSATTGTLFNDTHLDLEKWFMAVALMVNAKKGLSALQLKRDLSVAYKTACGVSSRTASAKPWS